MSKFFKNLVGGKKTPPNPPKPDYSSSSLKSTSVQDLLSRSPTNDRFSDGNSTTSVYEFDETMIHTGSTRSIDRKMRDKDRFSMPRQYSSSRNDRYSVNVSDDLRGRLEIAVDSDLTSKANRTPPGLLADYSDPCDLRKQIVLQQTAERLAVGANNDLAQQSDDDYSVPYDVKKKMQEKQLADTMSRQAKNSVPDEDLSHPYEEAWQWQTPAQMQAAENLINNGIISSHTTDDDPKSNLQQNNENSVDNNDFLENSQQVLQTAAISNVDANVAIETSSKTVECNKEGCEKIKEITLDTLVLSNDNSSYAFMQEESVASAINKALASGLNSNNGPANIVVSKPVSSRLQLQPGNYEEPWDLVNTQEKLEEKLRLAAIGKSGLVQVTSANYSDSGALCTTSSVCNSVCVSATSVSSVAALPITTTSSSSGNISNPSLSQEIPVDVRSMEGYDKPWDWQPHKKDDRAQEGYDKPWDWKPHKKDDRAQEGYDKPWDWKPHQKDNRPQTEYDQPWDQKAKGIEKEIMKAKGAMGGEIPRGRKDNDIRPPEEYDTPWDQKAKKLFSNSQGKLPSGDAGQLTSESPSKMPGASVPLSLSPVLQSHSRPSTSSAMPSPVGERIDLSIPLDQQGWYHGSIGRTDAEAMLRVHPEGSYLVRQSESSKQDFSLSLKSSRGFMHMKIVNRDGKFILGQFSQPFDNIPQMIHHYSRNKLPIKGAEHMNLIRPIVNDML